MSYRCLIVEDNLIERDSLTLQLNKINEVTVAAAVTDGMAAVSFLKTEQIDIVFSDIDMPELSGIELLRSLKKPPVFIFTTSHPEHAAESFELDVVDYIVKPVKLERLIKAVDKAIEYLSNKSAMPDTVQIKTKDLPETLQDGFIRSMDAQQFFFIKENNSYIKINMGDVLYVESMGDFSRIHTCQKKIHMVLISLKNLEKQLPADIFMRVHKQYIINVLHINLVNVSDVRLSHGITLPLSAAYKLPLQDNLINKKILTRFIE